MALWVRAAGRARNTYFERPSVDWLAALVITVALAVIQRRPLLDFHTSDQRMNIYATVASVAAIIGGFGTAAISQYATSSGYRMTILRERFGPSLRSNWVSLLTSMTAIAGGCLIAMLYDTQKTLGWPGWAIEILLVLGAFRGVRLIWLFRLLIDVSDHDATSNGISATVNVVDRTGGNQS